MKNFFSIGAVLICAGLFLSRGNASYVPVLPPGTILHSAATVCPGRSIQADGSSLLRSGTYAALFSAIGTTYGTADGTHFTLPNAKGVFLRGAGSQTVNSITYTGTQGTTSNDQFQGHVHPIYNPSYGGVMTITAGSLGAQITRGATGSSTFDTNTYQTVSGQYGTDGSYAGNSTPRVGAETNPANISVLICITY